MKQFLSDKQKSNLQQKLQYKYGDNLNLASQIDITMLLESLPISISDAVDGGYNYLNISFNGTDTKRYICVSYISHIDNHMICNFTESELIDSLYKMLIYFIDYNNWEDICCTQLFAKK